MDKIANMAIVSLDKLFWAILLGWGIGFAWYFAVMLYDVEYRGFDKREAKQANKPMIPVISACAIVVFLFLFGAF